MVCTVSPKLVKQLKLGGKDYSSSLFLSFFYDHRRGRSVRGGVRSQIKMHDIVVRRSATPVS
jgi:hypothetical protein